VNAQTRFKCKKRTRSGSQYYVVEMNVSSDRTFFFIANGHVIRRNNCVENRMINVDMKTSCICGGYKQDYGAFPVQHVEARLTSVGSVDVEDAHDSLTQRGVLFLSCVLHIRKNIPFRYSGSFLYSKTLFYIIRT